MFHYGFCLYLNSTNMPENNCVETFVENDAVENVEMLHNFFLMLI